MGYSFEEHLTIPNGRFVQWAAPERGRYYALGVDCALGIPGKDRDAGILFDTDRRQVGSLHGHWGDGFTEYLAGVADYYGKQKTLIVVEAAKEGIYVARQLFDRGYWLYYNRKIETKGRIVRDMLGHVPEQWDYSVKLLQSDLANDRVQIRDEELHGQLCKFGFRPRSSRADAEMITNAAGMTWGAPPGEFDDLVRAAALANLGIEYLPMFTPPPAPLDPDSIGARIDHSTEVKPTDDDSYWDD